MSNRQTSDELTPRNGHTLVVSPVARISGCQNQKEESLEDQVDHAKEEVAWLYTGPVEYRIISTRGKGEALDRPELAEPGTYRIHFQIPSLWLLPSTYSLYFKLLPNGYGFQKRYLSDRMMLDGISSLTDPSLSGALQPAFDVAVENVQIEELA